MQRRTLIISIIFSSFVFFCTRLSGVGLQFFTPENDSVTVFTNANIFNSETGKIEKGNLIISGEKIIGKTKTSEKLPEKAKVYNLDGQYIFPGLIDAHVHLSTFKINDAQKERENTEEMLKSMLFAGITTVRDMAGNGALLNYYKQLSENLKVSAPDIFFSAKFSGPNYFEMVCKYSDCKSSHEGESPYSQTITANTNIPNAILLAKGSGATGIKIYNDISADLVKKITAEAHKQNLMVWSHLAVFPALPKDVISTKVNSVSHAFYFANQIYPKIEEVTKSYDVKQLIALLQEMKANNIVLDATLYIGEQNDYKMGAEVTKEAYTQGVKIGVGTDWPYQNGEIPIYNELKILTQKCGLTNLDAIISATKINAEQLGLKDRGTIGINKKADLIILEKNPLDDIKNLENPKIVVKSGRIYSKK